MREHGVLSRRPNVCQHEWLNLAKMAKHSFIQQPSAEANFRNDNKLSWLINASEFLSYAPTTAISSLHKYASSGQVYATRAEFYAHKNLIITWIDCS